MSQPMTEALLDSIVKAGLDRVFFDKFDMDMNPDFASVRDGDIFMQETSDRAAEIEEVYSGPGYWSEKGEEENVPSDSFDTGNQVTYSHVTYANSFDISKELFDDDLHSVVQSGIKELALTGRATQEKNGMSVFRNAFDSSFTGGDGQPLCSDSHTLLGPDGGTFDNKGTLAFGETSLYTAIQHFMEMPNQNGVIMGARPRVLLVPPALYKEAIEVTDAELRSQTADNDPNVYSMKFNLKVVQSPHLGSASGGDNENWFLLGENHGLKRFVRESISTNLIPWEQNRNDNYVYKARYRESVGWSSPIGVWGSQPA